jgi:hypothetical protein
MVEGGQFQAGKALLGVWLTPAHMPTTGEGEASRAGAMRVPRGNAT